MGPWWVQAGWGGMAGGQRTPMGTPSPGDAQGIRASRLSGSLGFRVSMDSKFSGLQGPQGFQWLKVFRASECQGFGVKRR